MDISSINQWITPETAMPAWRWQRLNAELSRREILKAAAGVAAAGAFGGMIVGSPRTARANPALIELVLMEAIKVAVGWVVTQLLGLAFGQLIERLKREQFVLSSGAVADREAGGFHNQYSCPWEMPQDMVAPTQSKLGGYASVSGFSRSGEDERIPQQLDWNLAEAQRAKNVWEIGERNPFGKLIVDGLCYPSDYRCEPTRKDQRRIEDLLNNAGGEPRQSLREGKVHLQYVRIFRNPTWVIGQRTRGYGLKVDGQKFEEQFMLDV